MDAGHSSFATFRSPKAASYSRQLIKHFSHKIPVTEDGERCVLSFSCGIADLTTGEDMIRFRLTSPTKAELHETQEVMESHLLRFAFRDKPAALEWRSVSQ